MMRHDPIFKVWGNKVGCGVFAVYHHRSPTSPDNATPEPPSHDLRTTLRIQSFHQYLHHLSTSAPIARFDSTPTHPSLKSAPCSCRFQIMWQTAGPRDRQTVRFAQAALLKAASETSRRKWSAGLALVRDGFLKTLAWSAG